MDFLKTDERRVSRWYFGGIAGSMAACFTHPLDLLKVHLQTQQQGKVSLPAMSAKIYKSDGFTGVFLTGDSVVH
uniref:Mitochondrial carrier domain-containing protein n=1 Tax=Globodera pallida TaxID=36090 RepID=A0A183BVY4_GLOPA